jgi:hypothetical protein
MESIDKQIAWHYSQIASLKAKRNSIAPIGRLPNELLSRIIAIYAVDSDSLFTLKWTKIMLVCWHWHHLGVAAHPLWSFIDLGWSGRWDRLYGQLRRSGVAPLTLKIPFCDSSHYIQVILDHCERLRALEVTGEARLIHKLLTEIPNHNFPILTNLHLDPDHKRDEIPAGFIAVLPDSILNGGLPNLRGLHLTSINLPQLSVRGLESLSLVDCNDSGSLLQTFDVLFEMLELCPQLGTLRLENTLPPDLDFPGHRIVHLPALTFLRLRDHVLLCRTVLQHLAFPLAARVHIYPGAIRSGPDIREILVPICRRIRASGAPRPALLSIDCYGSTEDTSPSYCSLSTNLNLSPPDLSDENPSLLMLNSHPSNPHALRQILSKVIKAISFEHITHLDLRLATYLTPLSWRTVLKLLPALDTAYVQVNIGAIHLLGALLDVERLDPERETYPRLQRLHVQAVVRHKTDSIIPTMLSLLKMYLTLCHGLDAPLPVLEIVEYHFCLAQNEELLETLCPLVGEQMIRNGRAYNPVKSRQQRTARLAEWQRVELGSDSGSGDDE